MWSMVTNIPKVNCDRKDGEHPGGKREQPNLITFVNNAACPLWPRISRKLTSNREDGEHPGEKESNPYARRVSRKSPLNTWVVAEALVADRLEF
ncbi:hypothetical protein CEXT_254671 [Caerostris extrusa]|uniref:Uncharacterized protein n=1 Tax=Caerostris extrusa TaxID=172846 RepID=A0AAV4PYI7_CAEEX|nr:hypothetical protein CEXT_254671 [Caerostris extrusa]